MALAGHTSGAVPRDSWLSAGSHIAPVELEKAVRLINHGPTVLVSARSGGVDDVMAAAWACPLDFSPPKLTVVLDAKTATRELIDKSGQFVVQVPTARQAGLTFTLGSNSLKTTPDKLVRSGVELLRMDGFDLPFVSGCSAWLACKVVPAKGIQDWFDLFIAEIVGAWADRRIFRDGHWQFENADPEWRSLHYVAGGHFYAVGEAVDVSV
ncbi:flavin reductase family protein [Rhizobium leguminosarum]|uniref:flavin reductase family protein n=1 Tax=Rhizobium leguminosarum TaxID=384 RepID=UPI001C91A061|nr:flavin reductase family protein [Rhizobium leguminosarum]MBY3043763.1 flavin reductase family protein [Rhizobium leguminosarum]